MKRQSSMKINGNIPLPVLMKSADTGDKMEIYEEENNSWIQNCINAAFNWNFIKRNAVGKVSAVSEKKEEKSFHSAIGSILVMAQCFGILPVRGITNRTPHQLNFQYLSHRVAYACLLLGFLLLAACYSLRYCFVNVGKDGTKVFKHLRTTIWGGVFYGNAFLATLLFLKLASKWPSMMMKWYEMEQNLKEWAFCSLKNSFLKWTAIIMVTAFCDQIFFTIVTLLEFITSDQQDIVPCPMDGDFTINMTSSSVREIFQIYSCRTHWFIFDIIKYNECIACLLFLSSKFAIFIWNFTDLFIILISIGLSQRFAQFNDRIRKTVNEKTEEKEWESIREHYNLLSRLVRRVDKEISGIVLLSFANNLCCLGLQITKTFSDQSSSIERLYYLISFLLLATRTVLVTYRAAKIHEQSRDSLPYLYGCHPNSYFPEVERLQTQMTINEIALTGFRLFSVTKSFILVVAGCIFTYIIVLLQFYVALQTMMDAKEDNHKYNEYNVSLAVDFSP